MTSGAQLSPDWTEWLMGWPVGWTDVERAVPDWRDLRDDPADLPPTDPAYLPRITSRRTNRRARIKAIGNGQVPLCAAYAAESGRSHSSHPSRRRTDTMHRTRDEHRTRDRATEYARRKEQLDQHYGRTEFTCARCGGTFEIPDSGNGSLTATTRAFVRLGGRTVCEVCARERFRRVRDDWGVAPDAIGRART